VPLTELAATAIEWWWTHGWGRYVGRKPKQEDLLFPTTEGTPWRPRSAEQLRHDLHLAGLPTQFKGEIGFVFHRTRGTFSTWLAREGTPYDLRRHLLGHGAVGVTDGSYEEQEEALPEEVAKLQLGITLDELTAFEEPPLERRLEARQVAIATANSNVFGRRKKAAASELRLADRASSDASERQPSAATRRPR